MKRSGQTGVFALLLAFSVSGMPGHEAALADAARRLAEVWGDAEFVKTGGEAQQAQVTYLLQKCLRHVPGERELSGAGITGPVVAGVQEHMHSPVHAARVRPK